MFAWKVLNTPKKFGLVIALLFVLALAACQSTSTDTPNPLTARLSEIIGQVLSRATEGDEFAGADESTVLEVGAQVRTEEDSRVRLDLNDGSIIRLSPQTLFTLQGQEETSGGLLTRFKLEAGKIWVILSGGAVDVDTPSGVASVRGSYMSVAVDPATKVAIITCLEGDCTLTNGAGTIKLSAGQKAYVANYDTPPEIGVMTDEDVQEWLDVNPEATVVVPPLTRTPRVTPTPSSSPTPSKTPTSTPTETQTPTATPIVPSPTATDKWGSGSDTVP